MSGGAFVASDYYNHYSLQRTIELALGLRQRDQQRPVRPADERVLGVAQDLLGLSSSVGVLLGTMMRLVATGLPSTFFTT